MRRFKIRKYNNKLLMQRVNRGVFFLNRRLHCFVLQRTIVSVPLGAE